MEEDHDLTLSGNAAVVDAELRDENFRKLLEDFSGSQTGEQLGLDEKPCKNRLLIQVGLMKEDKQLKWEAVIEWLQKIFPMYQSADFRCLIERGIATTLSLGGDARLTFLESNVNFEFVGPICDSIGVGRADLLETTDFSERAESIEVTNGLILELSNFVIREKIDPIILVSWLRNFNPRFCGNGNIQKASKVLQAKLRKFRLHYRNYQTRRQRRNAKMEHFLQSPFELVSSDDDGKRLGGKKRAGKRGDKPPAKVIKEEDEACAVTARQAEEDDACSEVRVKEECWTDESLPLVPTSADPAENPDASKGEPLTLLDIAMLSVQKLSSVYGGKTDASKQVSHDLLKNQYTLTCKENAAMKRFDEKVSSLRDRHSLATPLHFLHCHAHFLVDMHDAIEQQMMSFEGEIMTSTGEKLGRDRIPKFASFVNFAESNTSRFVHMACDVLSPRAAANHNYRRHWVAFCDEKNNPSRLAVNRSNRFNNYFEAAAGLVHHHGEIALFFSDLLLLDDDSRPNVVLESVTEDASDGVIKALVCVLAIIYCKILGPYWQLLKSGGEYSLFSQYILCLYQKLLEWAKDASPLLQPESVANVFLQVPLQEQTFGGVFAFCGPGNAHVDLIKVCLQKMVKVIASVTEANLMDFLPGGPHSQNPPLELSTKLMTCTFSTLMAEYPFGHAYPYKRKRPDQSARPLASSSCTEEEEEEEEESSSSESESDESPARPAKMAARATRGGARRPKAKRAGRKGRAKRSGREKPPRGAAAGAGGGGDPVAKATDDYAYRKEIIAAVARNGGSCVCKGDVDKLLGRLAGASHAQKREAVRCEISYHKLILGCRDPNLVHIGFSLTDMVAKLKSVLPGGDGGSSSGSASGSSEEEEEEEDDDDDDAAALTTTESADAPQTGLDRDADTDNNAHQSSIDMANRRDITFHNYRENFDEFPYIS